MTTNASHGSIFLSLLPCGQGAAHANHAEMLNVVDQSGEWALWYEEREGLEFAERKEQTCSSPIEGCLRIWKSIGKEEPSEAKRHYPNLGTALPLLYVFSVALSPLRTLAHCFPASVPS